MKKGEPEATWFVYVLRCSDDSLCTGITNDVPRRLKQHNAGTASRYMTLGPAAKFQGIHYWKVCELTYYRKLATSKDEMEEKA